MEIEVGEYVRTDKGIIAKVDEIRLGTNREKKIFLNIYELDNGLWTVIDYITKHSKNIIDLIEVGDYVNGYKVIGVTLDPAPSGKYVDIDCDKPSYESYLFEEQIYSIVTKEQFESIECKVKVEG